MVEVEGRRIIGQTKRTRTHRASKKKKKKKRNKKKRKKETRKKTSRNCRAKTGEGPVFIHYYVLRTVRSTYSISPGSVGQIRLSHRNFRYGAFPQT